jgi:hypothetical protein
VVVFVETKRALGADEEPYSRTATIPDDGPAPVSAKNTAVLALLREVRPWARDGVIAMGVFGISVLAVAERASG